MNKTHSKFELEGIMQEEHLWEVRGRNHAVRATSLVKALHIAVQAEASNQIVDAVVKMPDEDIVILPAQIHLLTRSWILDYSGGR